VSLPVKNAAQVSLASTALELHAACGWESKEDALLEEAVLAPAECAESRKLPLLTLLLPLLLTLLPRLLLPSAGAGHEARVELCCIASLA